MKMETKEEDKLRQKQLKEEGLLRLEIQGTLHHCGHAKAAGA